jgi:hypothetical protein
MKFHVELPENLAEQARELAARKNTSVDLLIATALAAQLDPTYHRPTIAERAARVNWARVDEILARIPNAKPLEGDARYTKRHQSFKIELSPRVNRENRLPMLRLEPAYSLWGSLA